MHHGINCNVQIHLSPLKRNPSSFRHENEVKKKMFRKIKLIDRTKLRVQRTHRSSKLFPKKTSIQMCCEFQLMRQHTQRDQTKSFIEECIGAGERKKNGGQYVRCQYHVITRRPNNNHKIIRHVIS